MPSGETTASKFLGRVKRQDTMCVSIDQWLKEANTELPSGHGHVEFLYDFRDGGEGGWMAACTRPFRTAQQRACVGNHFRCRIFLTTASNL